MHGFKPKHYDRSAMPPRFASQLEILGKLIFTQLIYSLGCLQPWGAVSPATFSQCLTLPLTCCCSRESSVSTNWTTLAMLQSLPEPPHRHCRCQERKPLETVCIGCLGMCKQQDKQQQVRSGKEAGTSWGHGWSLPKCEIPNWERTFGKTMRSRFINTNHLLSGTFYLQYVWPPSRRREVFINPSFITSRYLFLCLLAACTMPSFWAVQFKHKWGWGFFCGACSELPVLPFQNRACKSSLQALKRLFVTVTLEKRGILAPIHESALARRPSLLRKALWTLLSFEERLQCLSEEKEEGVSGMGQKIRITGQSGEGQEYINKPYINLK